MKLFVNLAILFELTWLIFASKCPCKEEAHCEAINRPPGKEFIMFSTKPQEWKKYQWKKVTTIVLFREWDDELMCFAHSKVSMKGEA